EPVKTMMVEKKCMRGETRSQPKTSTARNPLSRKNAKMPSEASADPKTSPTKREYTAQLVPNSNSITKPVATPTAKLTAKSRVKKRVSASQRGSLVRRKRPSIITICAPSPIESGGKR